MLQAAILVSKISLPYITHLLVVACNHCVVLHLFQVFLHFVVPSYLSNDILVLHQRVVHELLLLRRVRIHFSVGRSAASVDDLLVFTTGVDDLLFITFVGVIVKLLTLHLGHVIHFVRVRWTVVVWIRFKLPVWNDISHACTRV